MAFVSPEEQAQSVAWPQPNLLGVSARALDESPGKSFAALSHCLEPGQFDTYSRDNGYGKLLGPWSKSPASVTGS